MVDLPAVNTLLQVVIGEDAEFRSRLEDIDGSLLTVAGPLGGVAIGGGMLDVPEDGDEFEVYWVFARSRFVVPVRMMGRVRGALSHWQLLATDEPKRCNRRRFVRGGGGGTASIRALGQRDKEIMFEGVIEDVCEGGVRCRVRQNDLVEGEAVAVHLSVADSLGYIPGTVLSVRAEDDGKIFDVVVEYELKEREAQTIRRYVMQWEIEERSRRAAARDRLPART